MTEGEYPAGTMNGFFSSSPLTDRLWSPSNLLFNGHVGSFLRE